MRPFVRNIKMIESDGTTETLKIRDNSLRDSLLFVRDFGADPSLPDNSSFINAAIRAAAEQHKALVFDQGTYYIKSSIVIELLQNEGVGTRDNKLVIYGNDCVIAADHCYGMRICGDVNGQGQQWINLTINDMCIQNKGGYDYIGNDGIIIGLPDRGRLRSEYGSITFNNVSVRHFNRAFHFQKCAEVTFNGCSADFCREEAICIDMYGAAPTVDDLIFNDCTINGAAGLKVHIHDLLGEGRVSGLHFNRCLFYLNTSSVAGKPSPAVIEQYINFSMKDDIETKDVWFSDCMFDFKKEGDVYLNRKDVFMLSNSYLMNLPPDADHSNVVELTQDYVGNFHINNCYFMCCQRVLNLVWADRVWFTNNVVYANGNTDGGNTYGALFSHNSSNLFITNNQIARYFDDSTPVRPSTITGGVGRIVDNNLGSAINVS